MNGVVLIICVTLFNLLFWFYKSNKLAIEKEEFRKYKENELKILSDKQDEVNKEIVERYDQIKKDEEEAASDIFNKYTELENKRKEFAKEVAEKADTANKTDKEIAIDSLFEVRKLTNGIVALKVDYENFKEEYKDNEEKYLINMNQVVEQCCSNVDKTKDQMVAELNNMLQNFNKTMENVITKEDVKYIVNDAVDNIYIPSSIDKSDIEDAVESELRDYFRSYDFKSDFSSFKDNIVSDIESKISELEYSITSKM